VLDWVVHLHSHFWTLLLWGIGLGVAICIVWDTLRLGISPMPSSKKSFDTLKEYLPDLDDGKICELGAGWGGVAQRLAAHYPTHRIEAYESAWISWMFLVLRFWRHPRVTVHRQNFLHIPLPQAQLYYTYLYPGGMQALATKLESEGQKDSIWVSFTFALPGYTPVKTLTLSDVYRSKIYFYQLPVPETAQHLNAKGL